VCFKEARGDQFVARKRGPPITLAARDKYDLALFVGKQIERLLDGEIGAPLSLASARVRQHVGPPFFAPNFSRNRESLRDIRRRSART
jgi:hypothetical protein